MIRALDRWGHHAPAVVGALGPLWVGRRLGYEFRRRLRLLELASQVRRWEEVAEKAGRGADSDEIAARIRNRLSELWPQVDRPVMGSYEDPTLAEEVEALEQGKMRFFGGGRRAVGYPPRWSRDPDSGQELPEDAHWSRIPHFGSYDIKRIWEPSRFTWAFTLVRHAVKGDGKRARGIFWFLLDDWMEHNLPNAGPNWACGQEAALRLIAASFGAAHLGGDAGNLRRFLLLALATGRRIAANIGYALLQRNNHGLSEAVGLWLAGFLCDGFGDAGQWRRLGRKLLERQVAEVFEEDGAFSQHSTNYHRLAVEVCLVAAGLARAEGEDLSGETLQRLVAAGEWLEHLIDLDTGGVPRYGQWDGAWLLPLSACSFEDFRPVVQAASLVLKGDRALEAGPWDEQAIWLTGAGASGLPARKSRKPSAWVDSSGYVVLRDETGFAFSRSGRFRFRPGQADLLHVDVWWRGCNVAMDPGTFSYSAPEPWANPLARTQFHNTVTVEDRDQMTRVGRFLWVPWPRGEGRLVEVGQESGIAAWEGWHEGYRRRSLGAIHRRALLRLGGGRWLVVDRVTASREVTARLHWLLPHVAHEWDPEGLALMLQLEPGPYWLVADSTPGCPQADIVVADPTSPRGWYAPTYGERSPAVSLAVRGRGNAIVLATFLGPERATVTVTRGCVMALGRDWRLQLNLADEHAARLIGSVHYEEPNIQGAATRPCTAS